MRVEVHHYIVYAFLEWRGQNDYAKPIYFYDEPIADGIRRAEGVKQGSGPPTKKP